MNHSECILATCDIFSFYERSAKFIKQSNKKRDSKFNCLLWTRENTLAPELSVDRLSVIRISFT